MVRIKSLSTWILFITVFCVSACSSKPCRGINLKKPILKKEEVFKKIDPNKTVIETVKVYKYDGSLQCGMGKPTTPQQMSLQLKPIKIISMLSKHDGLMHITVCGSPTGRANLFEIEKTDLAEARKRGFEIWSFGQ